MSQQQQQSLEERAVGEFAPYKPLVPGFERHTEPVRCALWEVYASTLPLIVGVCARNALVCLAPSFYNSPKLGFTGRLLVDHVVITTPASALASSPTRRPATVPRWLSL